MSEGDDVRLVKISELARMSGVPTPTIKHYLRAGLLPGPAKRTSRNMAYYDAHLAARVRAIKELQQERFLPLKVIAEVLEPAPSSELRADLDELQRRQLGILEPVSRAGHDEVVASMRITAEELSQLHELGLLTSSGTDAVYRGSDLEFLTVIHETRAQGLGELFPLEILPVYISAIRALVRVELDLFRRRVLGGARLPDMSLEQITRQSIALSERLVVTMRDKQVSRELGALADTRSSPDGGDNRS